jgi:hypothetical protein
MHNENFKNDCELFASTFETRLQMSSDGAGLKGEMGRRKRKDGPTTICAKKPNTVQLSLGTFSVIGFKK